MELQEIDLNLLVVLHELLRRRQVSAVAEALNTTQPAVSNSLNRLRKLLDDDLFLRTGRGVAPTPFALSLAEPVAGALGTLYDTLNSKRSFNPSTSDRSFTLAMTSIGEISFFPRLVERLVVDAPHVGISSVRGDSNLRDEMEAGRVDVAVGNMPGLTTGFRQRRLFQERYVCLMRKRHVLAGKKMTLRDFSEVEHVEIVASDTGHGIVGEVMRRMGIRRKIRLRVPHSAHSLTSWPRPTSSPLCQMPTPDRRSGLLVWLRSHHRWRSPRS